MLCLIRTPIPSICCPESRSLLHHAFTACKWRRPISNVIDTLLNYLVIGLITMLRTMRMKLEGLWVRFYRWSPPPLRAFLLHQNLSTVEQVFAE
jgi:hypothetical protein